MKNGTTEAKLMVPMAVIVIVAVMALVGSLWVWAEQADNLARTREESLVRKGLDQIAADQSMLMTPITIWDQATIATAVKYDPKWVRGNIGDYFQKYLKFESNVLLDADGKVRFAYHDGQEVSPSLFTATLAQTQSVTRDLRNRYASDMAAGRGYSADSNHAGKVIAADGRLYITGASLLLPDAAGSPLLKHPPFVVVGMHEIKAPELAALSDRYMVSRISLLPRGKTPPSGNASVAFTDANGVVLAQLSWQPETPGKTLFLRTIGPVLMISLGLGLVALVLLHTSQKTAQSLSASEAKAKHMALHDALTGLPNRTLFADRLSQACERMKRQGGQVAVMCIGLDRFKDVNDTLGHLAGDELIRHNAAKINGVIRACDTLARLSGDEFVIIQTDSDGHSAATLAKRLLETLTGTVTLESGQVFSSCSIGVTLLIDGEIEPAEALRQADLALYRAKDAGRGQYAFFEVEMDATIKLRKTLETGLREAIHIEALDVVYQPQVDHFGKIVGVEALCRWTHPSRGPVSPGYFIPLAEECGLMNDLGAFVLRRAMQDSHRWPGLKVAVNVSATQMRHPDFVRSLGEMLAETRTQASQIEIEITEGVLLADDHASQLVPRDLRHMGFSIALDDFGTGYSSLGYLSRYPVDKIKIDRSFVSNLGNDPEAEAVIRAIVKLSKALNLNIIAEGVETRAQKNLLRQAGCQIIQGFLYSRPVPVSDIDAFMRDGGGKIVLSEEPEALRQAG
ncbi:MULTISPECIES: EAL domain-containing protein [Asticcacaulis]|uniref:bifunctional diguanylate cyclase/phosphodiesterase n=1 Tax=Asticcacaulis TaxID=76890 RepID=UPI0028608773|nr:EAL domain-containing protein [Asticcacaulis sp. BE141]MBP2159492.1 diguanylate cyclase (GGDEF)-like protein [Asticcacaulis solisilvae]MDR6800681.1 diguanylate cyclase (GGDEF)-like protein [Asticcacaulis sp. BE141]